MPLACGVEVCLHEDSIDAAVGIDQSDLLTGGIFIRKGFVVFDRKIRIREVEPVRARSRDAIGIIATRTEEEVSLLLGIVLVGPP